MQHRKTNCTPGLAGKTQNIFNSGVSLLKNFHHQKTQKIATKRKVPKASFASLRSDSSWIFLSLSASACFSSFVFSLFSSFYQKYTHF